MPLIAGVPNWYGTYNDQTINQAVQEQYALSFGKKVGMTLTFGSSLEEYAGEFTSITVLEDSTTFTVTSWDEPTGSDTNTNALTYSAGAYIVGKFKAITVTAGTVRIN